MSSNRFQKRKYRPGFHYHKNSKTETAVITEKVQSPSAFQNDSLTALTEENTCLNTLRETPDLISKTETSSESAEIPTIKPSKHREKSKPVKKQDVDPFSQIPFEEEPEVERSSQVNTPAILSFAIPLIVTAFSAFLPFLSVLILPSVIVGLILGIAGLKKAQEENFSQALPIIGIILNGLVLLFVGFILYVFLVLNR